MRVQLWTRCGCSREVLTTYPPPREIILPLFRDIPGTHAKQEDLLLNSAADVRHFKLRYYQNVGPQNSTADYFEARE